MKIRIASDIHIEFLGDYHSHPADNGRDWNSYTILPKMENDQEQTLFLAGDICMLEYTYKLAPFLDDVSKRFKEVIVVCGNHEFYRHQFEGAYDRYRDFLLQWKNIHLLQNEFLLREDLAIFGATLWTDFDRENYNTMAYAAKAMGDFKTIYYKDRIWRPEDSVMEHKATLFHLNEFFKMTEGLKRVITTHHLPSHICGDPKFKGHMLNPAFSSNLDHIIIEEEPLIWICGHTHHTFRQKLHETLMLINPRGYYNGRENPNYNGQLVVDTDNAKEE